ARGIANVRFLAGRAEDVGEDLAPLRLATFGPSFHWMDRLALADRLFPMLEPGGGLVAIASASFWSRSGPWQTVVIDTIKTWLGDERRAGAGTYREQPYHQEILRETRFGEPTVVDFVMPHTWTTDSLIGYLYSTSFASRAVLAERAEHFERDLRARL